MPEYELSLIKPEIYSRIEHKLKALDKNNAEVRARLNRLSPDEWKNLHDFLIVRDTQSSLAIEDIKLDPAEVAVQYNTCFVAGIPVESRKAMEGMFAAWDLLDKKAARGEDLSIAMIQDTHNMVYHRINPTKAGVLRDGYVHRAGSSIKFCPPDEVEKRLTAVVNRVNQSKDHPVVKALFTGYAVFSIHPFFDGNSRTTRLLQNMLLTKEGYMQAHVPETFSVQYEKQREAAALGNPEGYYSFMLDMIERELTQTREFLGMPKFELPGKMSFLMTER